MLEKSIRLLQCNPKFQNVLQIDNVSHCAVCSLSTQAISIFSVLTPEYKLRMRNELHILIPHFDSSFI